MTNNYKLILSSLTMLLISTVASAQIPNAGFESWHTAGFPSYNEPDTWGTLNSSTSIISVFTTEKATGAGNFHNGSASIKLSTHFISFANQVAPGITVSSATINTSTQAINGGFVYNQRPTHLGGWFKGTPATNDSSSIELTLWKWVSNVKTEIGTAKFTNRSTVSAFTQFLVPINYTSGLNPDSALIIMSSSDTNNPVDGSLFYVDDLAFVNCTAFTGSASSTNATCTAANGSATITAAGATAYHWSNNATTASITNVAAGTYSVTATNVDGCPVTASTTVNANTTAITSTITSTATTCGASTGSATVTPTNGTPTYSYVWNVSGSTASITGLGAGGYQVTVTDVNGCSGTASTSVTTPNGPSATQVTTNITCNGANNGAIDVTHTGGTGNINYAWSPSGSTEDLSGLAGGTYTLTITDQANCSFTISALVNEPAVLTATTSHTNVTCNGANNGTITVTVGGGTAPYSFSGNPVPAGITTFSNLAPNNFVGNVTDTNGCTAAINETITEPTVLVVTLTVTDASSSVATDGSIAVATSGGTTPYTTTWSSGNGTALAIGNYTVTVTDGNGCTTTATATVSAPSAIGNVTDAKIKPYPNPANEQLTIETGSSDGKFNFAVYTIEGKLLTEKIILGDKITMDVKQLPVGFYSYQLKNIVTGNASFGKLQIQR